MYHLCDVSVNKRYVMLCYVICYTFEILTSPSLTTSLVLKKMDPYGDHHHAERYVRQTYAEYHDPDLDQASRL